MPRGFRLVKKGSVEGELLSNLEWGTIAQVVIAVAAVLAICYVAKLPLVTLAFSILIAFILAPIADRLERWRVPRWAGSFIAVALFLSALYGVAYFSYAKAVDFLDELPKYSENIRETIKPFQRQAEKIRQTTESVMPQGPDDGKAIKVRQQYDVSSWLTNAFSGVTEVIFTIAFIPFLVYFMLTWKDHARDATVKLFDERHRQKVHVTLGRIADMLKAFLVGNFVCGLFLAVVSTIVFGFLKLPYFYFLGLISGFLSLVPYLGVVFATLPPIVAGVGQLSGEQMIAIGVVVVGLHVFAVNVLFPKVIGRRLKLNPLVVTIALLGWGWLWGALGLILAVPITGAIKIICDHIEALHPVGAWMED